MCAIAGFFGLDAPVGDSAALARVMESMRHRGPDDSGVFIEPEAPLALGHNRLSIVDLSAAGRQPMINRRNGDVLVFNGEIYNHRELRDILSAAGHSFRSQCDSEVLLRAFEQWGLNTLDRIRGMFAFAIWRPRHGEIVLARDPMGMKPLYYRLSPDRRSIVFASEAQAFRSIARIRIDSLALLQFLEFGYAFDHDRTIFRDIRKLPPGAMIVCRRGEEAKITRFFSPRTGDAGETADALEDELFETLDAVVAQHLSADVPVALLLSGGLDSSILAAIAARRQSVHTLTMAFEGAPFDERPFARRVADHVGASHEAIVLRADDMRDSVEKSAALLDDLFSDWGALSTRLLYKACAERGYKAVLVGEGADELFGGYDIFQTARRRLPVEMWLLMLHRRYAGRRYGRTFLPFRRIMKAHLRAAAGDRFAALRLFETRNQLPNNFVMKVDKASMSASTEARVPFVDQRIAEIAYRASEAQLMSARGGKQLLRRMAIRRGLLPVDIVTREKFGAGVAANWMEDDPRFRLFARDAILAEGGWAQALGLRRPMEVYFLKNRAGYPAPHALSIFRNLAWRLLLLEMWGAGLGIGIGVD